LVVVKSIENWQLTMENKKIKRLDYLASLTKC
jgi:hypothetical protein